MVERQVRYNINTDTGVQTLGRHRWTIVIVNDRRGIRIIKERMVQQLEPMEPRNLDTEPVSLGDGLCYDYFSFSSERGRIESPNKMYRSKMLKMDRDLLEGRTAAEIERYIKALP